MNQECITNRMIKRLEELKKEKETLAMEVEREEEMMSNTLQRKLTQVIHLFCY
jgi:coiled-coil domain-containing protein 6